MEECGALSLAPARVNLAERELVSLAGCWALDEDLTLIDTWGLPRQLRAARVQRRAALRAGHALGRATEVSRSRRGSSRTRSY